MRGQTNRRGSQHEKTRRKSLRAGSCSKRNMASVLVNAALRRIQRCGSSSNATKYGDLESSGERLDPRILVRIAHGIAGQRRFNGLSNTLPP